MCLFIFSWLSICAAKQHFHIFHFRWEFPLCSTCTDVPWGSRSWMIFVVHLYMLRFPQRYAHMWVSLHMGKVFFFFIYGNPKHITSLHNSLECAQMCRRTLPGYKGWAQPFGTSAHLAGGTRGRAVAPFKTPCKYRKIPFDLPEMHSSPAVGWQHTHHFCGLSVVSPAQFSLAKLFRLTYFPIKKIKANCSVILKNGWEC